MKFIEKLSDSDELREVTLHEVGQPRDVKRFMVRRFYDGEFHLFCNSYHSTLEKARKVGKEFIESPV